MNNNHSSAGIIDFQESSTVATEAYPSHEEKRPTISFSNQLRVILIPCREEYHACGIHQKLWWQATDYLQFKNDAKNEAMNQNQLSVKNAIYHLFQGHESDFESLNCNHCPCDSCLLPEKRVHTFSCLA